MKKFYSFFGPRIVLPFLVSLFLFSNVAFGQSICGGIVENFNNTSGSTNGFTGDFTLGTMGDEGYLMKDRAISRVTYAITTPTYQLPAGATSIGYGFTLDGTVLTSEVRVTLMYFTTLTNEMVNVQLAEIQPFYGPGSSTAIVCNAVALTSLPGFPPGGRYRLRFEFSPVTGSGEVGQMLTFDDFRTNGTFSQIPLPVNFVGFTAKKTGSEVLLTWKIAGEVDVDRYEVERSTDGRNFSTIASVARHGKDTYTYTDFNNHSTLYYRIKNVDNDGKFKYSTVARIINGKSDLVLKAFPQPVQSLLTVQHPSIEGRAQITISSADGRVIRSLIPASGSIQTYLDMSTLQKGLYMIRFDAGNGKIETMKVIKQ